MLLDPGPLRLVTDADIPRPGPRPTFAGLVAAELAIVEGHDRVLAAAHSRMAAGLDSPLDGGAALDLAAAQAEHDRQVGAVDSTIASVQAGADVLEGDLVGLSNDAQSDLRADFPIAPDLPRDDELWPDYPGDAWTAWDTFTIGLFRTYLDRAPTRTELAFYRNFFPDTERARAWILDSDEYRERQRPPAPPAPPPPALPPPAPPAPAPVDEFKAGVIALYNELLFRTPSRAEIDSHRGNPGGLAGVRETILESDEYAALHN